MKNFAALLLLANYTDAKKFGFKKQTNLTNSEFNEVVNEDFLPAVAELAK